MHVTLLRGDIPLGTFAVHNISSGGIALRGTLAKLPYPRLLTVRLHDPSAEQPTEARALVVHQRDDLIGLMWADHTVAPHAAPGPVATAHTAQPVFW